MIIIDGTNHYPQDIEHTVEKAHPAVRPGCCAAFSVDVDGEERLAVVVEVGEQQAAAAGDGACASRKDVVTSVRRAIAECHDLHVHRVCLIEPRSIHKTTSGKIMRQACRADFLDGSIHVVAGE
jgi:acyl-CoA synthetase (AMP-forming)/AMP-acid ligase II